MCDLVPRTQEVIKVRDAMSSFDMACADNYKGRIHTPGSLSDPLCRQTFDVEMNIASTCF